MNPQILTQGFDLTPAIKAHVEEQLNFNLANYLRHITSVTTSLRDINGPKGGPDKNVVVCVHLGSRSTVTVERTRTDLYVAITLAARQIRRAVRRALAKRRQMEKLAIRELRRFPQV